MKQLVESVEYLHKNNITHRDLKPDNLCDFGLSKLLHELSDRYKQSSVKNTADFKDNVNYMAPEGQTTEYNHLIDVYSLALIGAKIFGFSSNNIRDGIFDFDFKSIDNFDLRLKMVQMYTLLLSMSVSIYTENCAEIEDIWKQRPECVIIIASTITELFAKHVMTKLI
ncbi:unnamed protein product [Medioppia subpectinata]|uniref:Protein kinase domain-containing protein n=1 Tax=Medioppia subpectinata TaxID=1979941 RepID=A0A7R9QCW1_9ACAR|nr:unnamed protein product [Medioppia subpectinata]CAG2118577.1 unnamed protein product [Medioppia subpectinata]